MHKHRVIAVYLPQYHPIPLNDKWNGSGFTEWTNVKKAKPRFKGHYQPHLPTNLGFYDLRNSETREKQVTLAKEYGIYGFAYYHYWFSGQRLLNLPIDTVLKEGKPDFPFCFIWANKSWKINKDTSNPTTILEQKHDFDDDIEHIHFLKTYFQDNRYIKINGKPLFIIYDSGLFPDIKKTIEIWRNEAIKIGIGEIYLARWERDGKRINPRELGFDVSIEFQPDMTDLPKMQTANIFHKIRHLIGLDSLHERDFKVNYSDMVDKMITREQPKYKRFPCIIPNWDNSPRRNKGAGIIYNSTPELFEIWLSSIVNNFVPYSEHENIILVNAWNEWAESMYLEPCEKWDTKYLEIIKKYM